MKDYSKLRPFDLEAAKRGEEFCFIECGESKPRKFIAGPDAGGGIVVQNELGRFDTSYSKPYKMSPLAWVRASADDDTLWPVYKGDVLWHSCGRCTVLGLPTLEDHDLQIMADGLSCPTNAMVEFLTFTPPKVKREGWGVINKAELVATKEEAEHYRNIQLANPDWFVVVKAVWEE